MGQARRTDAAARVHRRSLRNALASSVSLCSCPPHLIPPQVEFADVLVLNKVDLITPDQASQLEALLHKLNRHAKVMPPPALSPA